MSVDVVCKWYCFSAYNKSKDGQLQTRRIISLLGQKLLLLMDLSRILIQVAFMSVHIFQNQKDVVCILRLGLFSCSVSDLDA